MSLLRISRGKVVRGTLVQTRLFVTRDEEGILVQEINVRSEIVGSIRFAPEEPQKIMSRKFIDFLTLVEESRLYCPSLDPVAARLFRKS